MEKLIDYEAKEFDQLEKIACIGAQALNTMIIQFY